ncbi:MAG: protein kinase domain-containing protein, partial [Candidatus Polarisedimenticolia bacterium]
DCVPRPSIRRRARGSGPIPTPAEYIRRAKQAARDKDFAQAGDFYRLAGDWKRANQMYLEGEHYNLAARLAEEMGDLSAASLYHLKAGDLAAAAEIELRLDRRDKAAWYLSRAGQHQKAAELFEALEQYEAAADHWEKAGFREKAAILYVKAGKNRIAAGLFEKLIEDLAKVEPGHVHTDSERSALLKFHRFCGELYQRNGEPSKAAPHFEAALLPEPAAEAWSKAGEAEKAADIMLRLQRPEEASRILREAGKDVASLSPAVQAELLIRQGKHAEAAAIFEQAGSLFRAAEAYREAGQGGKAAELFEKEGENGQAADLYVRAGRPADAARLYEVERDYRNAAELYRKAGRLEEAARVYLKADDPVAAARLHYERKDFDACIKALQKVPSDNRDYRKASFLLGKIFAEQGLHTLAADKFGAAIGDEEVNDDTVIIYYSLALAQEGNMRPREALAVYQKILSFDYGFKDVVQRLKSIEETPLVRLGTRGGGQRSAAAETGWSEPGRYRVESSIGLGKLGEVFRGFDTALNRPVAIRRLAEAPHETGKAERFLKEAATAAQLSHPGIVSVFDTGADENGRFIVSALAEGRTLRALLDQKVRFEVNRIVAIGRQILEALEHAHGRGVLHRNLRPENIFVDEQDKVAVADFGLGVRLGDLTTEELSAGRIIQYTPPEVLLKDRVDARSDLYAFGVVLYEMAVGRPPFTGKDVGHQQVNAAVPPPGPGERPLPEFLKTVVLRCVEKDKEARYPDARAVLQDLEIRDIVPGMMVADRYEVMAEIGRGGMGTVFRAHDTELDETVALKFLGGEIGPDLVARFIQEIKTARQVGHPNVVRVFNFEKWRDHRFLVMEYIDGVPLPRWLARVPPPALPEKLRLACQLSSALEAAHKVGIVHRDIKPDNILVKGGGEAKILDFGIARPENRGHTLTSVGTVVGSPMYMSPEQIQALQIDRRTDIYSLGAVLYFLFTGVEPFAGRDVQEILMKHLKARPAPPHTVNPALPRPISEAVMRALHPDRAQRFQSAGDLMAILSHALQTAA